MAKATFEKTAQTEQPAVATSSERLGESLSAVMDGEADDLALRRLIQESAADPVLAEKWERYHLARDVIHGRGRPLSSGFSGRVAAAIDAETAPQAASVTGSRLPQPLVKFAIAATVAVVAVVALQPAQNGPELPAAGVSATD
ncbi:MAG: sigma-E factor negative regulatory protein, partial [Pseudohongiellaceae bacterium]